MGNEQSLPLAEDPGIQGKITVNIRAADKSEDCSVDLHGEVTSLVTKADLPAFKLSIDKLKQIIKPISPEKLLPDYIFFKSPTHVSAFRYTKQQAQCKMKLKPHKYTIIGKKTETIAVGSRTLENRSQVTGTYTNNMSFTETNTVGTTWSRNISVFQGLTVEHKIIIPGSAEVSFTSCHGEEKEHSSTVTIGSESGVSVELAPGQQVVAEIKLLKHVYEIEIEYEASASGKVIAVWDNFMFFQVCYYEIEYLMELAGLENTATVKEVIKMDYFTGGEVVLTGDNTKSSTLMSSIFGK